MSNMDIPVATAQEHDVQRPLVEVVQGTLDDLEAITDLMTVVYADTYPNDRGITRDMFEGNASFREHLQEYLIEQLKDPTKKLLIAKEGDEVLGTVGIAATEVPDQAEIWGFYVDPSAQGGGAANRLWDELMSTPEAANVTKFTLDVAKDSARAKAFYERRGFVVVGEEDWDWPHWTEEHPHNQYWLMEKQSTISEQESQYRVDRILGFMHLWYEAHEVEPGDYKLVHGTKEPISVQEGQVYIVTEGPELSDMMPGIHIRGTYFGEGANSHV